MDGLVTPEQQAALDALGVTKAQFVFYHARRIDGRYLTHAMATLLIYDFLITLGEEAQYIWKTTPRFSMAKGLWFLNRYWPLASVCVRIWAMAYAVPPPIVYVVCRPPNHDRLNIRCRCNVAVQFTAWSGLINIAIVDVLLMLRVWALYNGSRFVKWFLIGVFVVGFPTAIALRKAPPITGLPLVTPAPESLTICHRSPPAELFSLSTMALLIETIIFGMVIYRAGGRQFRSHTPMLSVLVRDGALYYAAITAVLGFMIAATFIPIFYQPVADANLNIPLSSLACNRLVLSLRGVYFRGGDAGAHSETPTITTSYHSATNRPPLSTRPKAGNTVRSPNLRNDFKLSALRTPSRRAGQKVGSIGSDWDQETEEMSAEVQSLNPASAIGHSRVRSFADVPPTHGNLSPTLSPISSLPLFGQVTVTRTRRTVTDEGVEYDLPLEGQERTSAAEQGRGRSVDSMEIVQGGAAQGTGASVHSPKPGVYESRVGYPHDRIPEELEERFVSYRLPGSL